MRYIKHRIKQTSGELEREIREKTAGYIVAGFSVVAGLAWNDAIKAFIEEYFPLPKDTMKAKFFYAVAITLVVVIVSLYITRLLKAGLKGKDKEKEKEAEAEDDSRAGSSKKTSKSAAGDK